MEQHYPKDRANERPRRRKRSRLQLFKETYLPLLIAGCALLMILIFVIGSITRAVQKNIWQEDQAIAASVAEAEKQTQLESEAESIYTAAKALSATYDYSAAIALLDSFSGDIAQFPKLTAQREACEEAAGKLVLWQDNAAVLNLSFHHLIADPQRAFRDAKLANSYKKNYVTTGEFTKMLQQLYENDYVLVSMDDITDGTQSKELYLPPDKKPLMLTQTQVNYYTYMTDSDGDLLPDAGGAGFASRLVIDPNGNLTCEMVTGDGQTVTGAYDLVPILEAFVQTHPDFSYKGARAILSVSGYDGLFGYRTNPSAENILGSERYEQELQNAKLIAQALRDSGYEIACYTYGNIPYGSSSADTLRADLDSWSNEVSPILGVVRTFVFAKNSDISGRNAAYEGEKYDMLADAGFSHFLGFSSGGKPWLRTKDGYVRQGRILVGGNTLSSNADWFTGIFDPQQVLDPARTE